ncbi:STAS domain-containing protein [Hydrocarboniclastica marina]|uniref:STAS domain-containing protein n=1 Tax=Hydrocarboniclastica marina TaxID=2259620 RepID=A0A4P7XIL1_9ALTE|nr:STAS domain-containing protein [Hydrocarboniclastica marina]MAL97997.1 hypothetical protein [Alteromonadaceae bacterium]QCF26563.1 STAS domain-containing protein [Hydrocarboniclastica marina]|tara:strand:+ start:799 stop:1164 length:366 start_codon:yes stop_codon:yes gene_type:complete
MAANKKGRVGVEPGRVTLAADETVLVSGQFDYQGVVAAREEGEKLIRALAASRCRIDLSGVESADSAFMALLLSWIRLCERRGVVLELVAVPEPLLAMARVSGLETILPVASEQAGARNSA